MKLNESERLELFNRHKNLAYSVAYKYNVGMEIEDTKQEALMALWVATERFDPERSETFSSYAYYIISEALQRNIVRNRHIVTVPSTSTVETSLLHVNVEDVQEDDVPVSLQDIEKIDMDWAMAKLPEETQKLIRMRMAGMTLREIEECTELSHKSVANIVNRGIELIIKRTKNTK